MVKDNKQTVGSEILGTISENFHSSEIRGICLMKSSRAPVLKLKNFP